MINQISLFEKEPTNVLLSLLEEPYNQMLSGEKRYEYRTRYLKVPTTADVYISRTKKKIVAKIEFDKPIIGTAEEIATLAEKEQPGNYNKMIDYFHGGTAYAIPIKKIIPLKEVSLEELRKLFPDFVVPQSYYILDKKPELLNYLKSKEY